MLTHSLKRLSSLEKWEKRIIEKFLERAVEGVYHISDVREILDSFGPIEFAANKAWDRLVDAKILKIEDDTNQRRISLNLEKQYEITEYYKQEPVEEVKTKLMPDPHTFKGLERRHEVVTENTWPNQGTYYLCTQSEDVTAWTYIYRSKPTNKPTRVKLGSLLNPDSKIRRMWVAVQSIGQDGSVFYKKQAEDLDQRAFGNNRQGAVAAFNIFVYLGWIKAVKRTGKQVFYKLDRTELYDALVSGQGHTCGRCSRVCLDRYCAKCSVHI